MTALTAKQILDLNRMNRAAQNVPLGDLLTLLDSVKDAPSMGAMNKIEASLTFADFVDSTGVTGVYTFTETIPIGAFVTRCVLQPALVGFIGDTSATITVGDGTDVDRYMTGTPNVFIDVAGGADLGVVNGTAYHVAAKAPVITITAATDWGDVTAGSLEFALYYFI